MSQNLKPFSSWDLFSIICCRKQEKKWHLRVEEESQKSIDFVVRISFRRMLTVPQHCGHMSLTSKISSYENWLELHLAVWIQYDNKHGSTLNLAKYQNVKLCFGIIVQLLALKPTWDLSGWTTCIAKAFCLAGLREEATLPHLNLGARPVHYSVWRELWSRTEAPLVAISLCMCVFLQYP